jgi:hypothetical protein
LSRTVYDCFCFFNELDLLEIRLAEHEAAVDYFVIVESSVTFQGDPKPLYFAEAKHRFRQYEKRIRHVVVEDTPATQDPWARERYQRNCLKRGLTDAASNAMIVISDVDEICRTASLREAASRNEFCFLEQQVYQYYIDWKATLPPGWIWAKAYAAPKMVIEGMADLTAPRAVSPFDYLEAIGSNRSRGIVDNAGWHFSWMGGVERMMTKLAAFSHTEPEVMKWRDAEALEAAVREQRFFYDGGALQKVDVDDSFPSLVYTWPDRYRQKGLLSPLITNIVS